MTKCWFINFLLLDSFMLERMRLPKQPCNFSTTCSIFSHSISTLHTHTQTWSQDVMIPCSQRATLYLECFLLHYTLKWTSKQLIKQKPITTCYTQHSKSNLLSISMYNHLLPFMKMKVHSPNCSKSFFNTLKQTQILFK